MAREGMRRHLDRNPDVRRDLAMWSNAWRANLLLMRLAAGPGASDDEAFRRFATFEPERALGASEIDVEEILSARSRRLGRSRRRWDPGRASICSRGASPRAPSGARPRRTLGVLPRVSSSRAGTGELRAPLDSLRGPARADRGLFAVPGAGQRIVRDSVEARALLDQAARRGHHGATIGARGALRRLARGQDGRRVQLRDAARRRDLLGQHGDQAHARLWRRHAGRPSLTPLWDWVPIWRAERTAAP